MHIKVNKKLKTPIYLQIAAQLKEQILRGSLVDGFALPSERIMAADLTVHRNTVVKAYNVLRDEELITSYQGIGYKVCYKTRGNPGRIKKVNWTNLIKEEYLELKIAFDDLFIRSQGESNISFAAGMAAANVYDRSGVAACLAETISESRGHSYFYTPYQGDLELRKEISCFMRSKGIVTNQSQIQIFSENNQALDFLVTLLLSPGDSVLMEESSSPDVFRAIELAGGRIITVPMDSDGMVCENLGPLIEIHRPKFIYVNSSYHNPTGAVLSMERRQSLLDMSYRYRVPIIEEDEASELYFSGSQLPTIKSMDRGENVIYMYSFSLTLVPGVGIAFVVAPKEVVKSLSNLVSVRLVTLDWMPQRLTREYLKKGTYYNKLEDFRKEYFRKQSIMCEYLDTLKDSIDLSYVRPGGGVYLWVNLPPSININQLLYESEKCGITFMPGTVFFPNRNPQGNYIRLNYSYPTETEIRKGMEILAGLMQKIQKG